MTPTTHAHTDAARPKIGIFSGTFDPVHVGHVAFALEAIKVCALAGVFFLPEPEPRQKTPVAMQHRKAMLEQAISKHVKLSVEVLPQAQFTPQQTLPYLLKKYPDVELLLLVGSDVVQTFSHRWPGVSELLKAMPLVVGLRQNDTPNEVTRQLEALYKAHHLKPSFRVLKSPHHRLASTGVRSGSHNITDLDPAVAEYIVQHNLYT